jgi:hypothetical protein
MGGIRPGRGCSPPRGPLRECFFWRTHTGAEIDLLVVRGGRRLGFEFKLTDSPAVTPCDRPSMTCGSSGWM